MEPVIEARLREVGRRIRLLRAVAWGTRGLLIGVLAALIPLALKRMLPVPAWIVAAGLPALGVLAGALAAVCWRLTPRQAALAADVRLGLKERFTSVLEFGPARDDSPVVRALLAEAARRAEALRIPEAFRLRLPRDARFLAAAAAAALGLVLLPPIPFQFARTSGEGATEEKAAPEQAPEEERQAPAKKEEPARPAPEAIKQKGQDFGVRRGGTPPRANAGDQAASFKDTSLSARRPDFNSFLKEGDERLKLLGESQSMPDLQKDFTQSPYQIMLRRAQQMLRDISIKEINREQLRELVREMERLGGRGGSRGFLDEGMLDEMESGAGGGSSDQVLESLEKALNRLRDREQAGRDSKRLRQARRGKTGAGTDEGPDGGDPGFGSLPGTDPSTQREANATDRIGIQGVDTGLEGDWGEGRREAYDTNVSGPGAMNASRLPFLEMLTKYRKQMEDALTREPIPLDYREQVKEYFQSLDR